jgi:predicted nucleic acid-binding protein
MRVVVDTSAVIAVIVGEAERAKLIEMTKDTTIVGPPSLDWEVGNAFSAMVRRSRITAEQAIEAIEAYQQIPLEIVAIDLKEAVRLAGKHKIYGYDAYILQCAIEHNLPLLSLDQDMMAIARQEGVQLMEVTQ